jgi:hypothetical protein
MLQKMKPGVLQPSPFKEISSRDYEGREVLRKHRTVIEPLLWSQWHEGRRDHFLNSKVGIMQTKTNFRVGLALMTTTQQKG